ncbi:hypothetical protein BpHYR1_027112 [Brachionus plicatilis]|uniref:Uncharacterized protein n=1 Tax=Brachionus plicatilis TaxID=10195 RepID=A0A3M7QXP2_BRAPC|nr:hypothetical protein BpHYR1_027112 [Brachionus plicatilis]
MTKNVDKALLSILEAAKLIAQMVVVGHCCIQLVHRIQTHIHRLMNNQTMNVRIIKTRYSSSESKSSRSKSTSDSSEPPDSATLALTMSKS